ncbi:hypothetical protein JQN72_00775 [Phycicoccus sp. CSK15P-2]|uniref:hypothetical protein n=1 Tax=Phycicoccus sp. CSK15P-2 TaxID=2807627 RepID=UPI00194FCDB9|nr:hypothetical protein [Phycicoccus sp. CSK15P-2]MBM6402778.1 hypothetical protein [Phycicoccus sp. CSK15P-2]
MTWPTALWLALRGGRSDRLRVLLTVAATSLASLLVLLAVAVTTPGDPERMSPYANDGLWSNRDLTPGAVLGIGLVALPFLAFAAQCSRVGGPARDRRFLDLERLGTSRRELRRLAALESGVASVVGTLVGIPLYALLAFVIARVGAPVAQYPPEGTPVRVWSPDALLLPTDRFPTWWVALPAMLLLPVLVSAMATTGLARTTERTASESPRRYWSAALVVGGVVFAALAIVVADRLHIAASWLFTLLALVALAAFALGAAGLTGDLGVLLGRALARTAGRVDLLLAGSRLQAHRRTGASRLTLLLGCLMGGAALVTRDQASEQSARQGDIAGFFEQTYMLVLVGLGVATVMSALGVLVGEVESIVERRRSLASAVASGVPRSSIRRAVVVECLLPVVPAVVVTTSVGAVAAAGLVAAVDRSAVLPWGPLLIFVAGVSMAVLVAALVATLALPASTDISEVRVPA